MSLVIPYHKEDVFLFTDKGEMFESTNFRVLNNTDYRSEPRFNLFFSMLHGELHEDGYGPRRLCDFFDLIAEPKLTDLWYGLKVKGKNTISDSLSIKGTDLEAKLDGLLVRITNNPLMRFKLDPRSSFRVERRVSEGESRLYDATLKLDVIDEDEVTEIYDIWLRAKLWKR